MRRTAVATLIMVALLNSASVFGQRPRSGYALGAGDVRLYYEITGSGPDTVLFLHGTPSTMYSLARDFSELTDGFTLIFFDQRGGGRSQPVRAPDSLTWQWHVQDIEALRRHLRIGQMHLFGVSWGSALAVLYAAEYPDRVGRIVIFPMRARRNPDVPVEPGPRLPPLSPAAQARADTLRTLWRTSSDPRAICEEYWQLQLPALFLDTVKARGMRGSHCDEPPEVLRYSWEVSDARVQSLGDWDLRPVLRRVRAAALVVKGSHTTLYTAWAEEWVHNIPNSRFMLIDGASSSSWITHPEVTFSALRTFYRGGWPSSANRLR